MAGRNNLGIGFGDGIINNFRTLSRTVLHRRALKCPCSADALGTSRGQCKNCRGCGFSYANERPRSVIISNLRLSEKYMSGGDHDSGDCVITGEADVRWARHDLLFFPPGTFETTTEAITFTKEPIPGGNSNETYWTGYTHYPIVSVDYMGEWVGLESAYLPVDSSDYTSIKDEYTIRLSGKYSERESLICTVRYQFRPAFEVFGFLRSIDARPVSSQPCRQPREVSLFVLMHARRKYLQKTVDNKHIGSHFLSNDFPEITDRYG